MRKLTRNIKTLANVKDKREQQALMRKSGEIIAEILDDDLQITDTETSIELNFDVLKFKHFTGTRAEYGLLYWLRPIKNIQEDADLELLRRNVGGAEVMQLSSNVSSSCSSLEKPINQWTSPSP